MKIKILIISLCLFVSSSFGSCLERLKELYRYQGGKVTAQILTIMAQNKVPLEDLKKSDPFEAAYININNMAVYAGYPEVKQFHIDMMDHKLHIKIAKEEFEKGALLLINNLEKFSTEEKLNEFTMGIDSLIFESIRNAKHCEVAK